MGEYTVQPNVPETSKVIEDYGGVAVDLGKLIFGSLVLGSVIRQEKAYEGAAVMEAIILFGGMGLLLFIGYHINLFLARRDEKGER